MRLFLQLKMHRGVICVLRFKMYSSCSKMCFFWKDPFGCEPTDVQIKEVLETKRLSACKKSFTVYYKKHERKRTKFKLTTEEKEKTWAGGASAAVFFRRISLPTKQAQETLETFTDSPKTRPDPNSRLSKKEAATTTWRGFEDKCVRSSSHTSRI